MGNFSALLLCLICFLVPLASPTLRRDSKLLVAAWGSILFRDAIALVNAFITPILSSWGDLYRFHNIGAGLDPEQGQPYGELLRVAYSLFGTSFWLGEQLSILAYTLSLLLFVEIALMVGAREKLLGCILLFGFMPSPALHCSVTLRESYQVLGFLGCACSLLRLRSKAESWVWPGLALSLVTMVAMHHGLAPYAAGLLALGIPWALQGRGQIGGMLALVCLTLVPMLLPRMIDQLSDHSLAAQRISEGRILEFAANYRNLVPDARSDYGIKIDSESFFTFTATSAAVVAMYFIAPLPWQMSTALDYYAFGEVLIRFFLLAGFVGQLKRVGSEQRQRLLFLFAMAASLECMWALGTTNWGTSLRHHVVAFGAFVLTGLPYYSGLILDKSHTDLLRRRESRSKAAEQEAPIDFSRIRGFLRQNAKLGLAITATAALLIVGLTRPQHALPSIAGPRYLSSGTLLVSPGRSLELGDLKATTYQRSDLTTWLSTEDLFDLFVERHRLHQRLEKLLAQKHPSLQAYSRSVRFVPHYIESEMINLYDGSSEIEVDYAQLEDNDENRLLRQRRANRIEVLALGPGPQEAQILARLAMETLQKVLAEVATRRITAQKHTIEGYLRVGLRKIARAEKALAGRTQAEPSDLAVLRKAQLALEAEQRHLQRELNTLRLQSRLQNQEPSSARPDQNPLAQQVQRLEQDTLAARQLYMPDSLTQKEADERLARAQKLMRQQEAWSQDQHQASTLAQIMARQTLMREILLELAQLKSRQPSARLLSEFRQKEKELETWQQEYLAWERQLLAARIEERLCRGDGTALPLRSPLPGTPTLAAQQEFLQAYGRTLALLPLAPLLGLSLMVGLHFMRQARKAASRVEYFMGAPVIAELPAPTPQQQRQWWECCNAGSQPSVQKAPGP